LYIPLNPADLSGVFLPPAHFMLFAERESTQPTVMMQGSGCSRWPLIARIDIPVSEILIA
jgi:hypothetical protein